MNRFLLILLTLTALILASCTPPQPQFPIEATPISTHDVTPINTREATPFVPQPSITLDAWSSFDPRDPSLPDLILTGENGLGLDPAWQVQSIALRYEWSGLGEGVSSFTEITREGDTFTSSGDVIPTDDVNAFLHSISDLHPTQSMLAGNMWTDDYPSWTVQIKGTDGQYLYIYSSSTGNPGSGPWNVEHNGRYFAQYTGEIGNTLGEIFSPEQGAPMGGYVPETGLERDQVAFATYGPMGLSTQGGNGLLALDAFSYVTNPETHAIVGEIADTTPDNYMWETQEPTEEVATMELQAVTITIDGTAIECPTNQNTDDPYTTAWTFECTLADHTPTTGERFRFPIRVDYITTEGEAASVEGELYGLWGVRADLPLLPIPPEIAAAFASSPAAQELLTDHMLGDLAYTAVLNAANPSEGNLYGEMVLLGQTEMSGQMIPYTIATPLTIENGQLTHFALTRASLNSMLDTIRQQAITTRIIEADPSLVLNLWYAEPGGPDREDLVMLVDSYLMDYTVNVAACQDRPLMDLPDASHPLMAFGFNSMPYTYWQTDFLIVDGKVLISQLDLSPNDDDPVYGRGPTLPVLIPPALETGTSRPFERIWFQNGGLFNDEAVLTLWVPEDATPEELEIYTTLTDAIPAEIDRSFPTIWEIKNVEGYLTPNGLIEIRACD